MTSIPKKSPPGYIYSIKSGGVFAGCRQGPQFDYEKIFGYCNLIKKVKNTVYIYGIKAVYNAQTRREKGDAKWQNINQKESGLKAGFLK